jgi:hypothetical protein
LAHRQCAGAPKCGSIGECVFVVIVLVLAGVSAVPVMLL